MNYRVDIQALRGIAVLLVVFYHARLFPIQNGFLGVDIFFVISGFLITSQITKQLNTNSFSFSEFYLRRAWRLLPTAYTVVIICCILAPWMLTYSELQDFIEQIWGALTFSANFVLWGQTGYFEDAAELKPLLHTWSLSIEEQYYLLMPALLAVTPKKHWLRLIALLSLMSLSAYMLMLESKPGAVFYFTPTRVWELGVGSTLALLLIKREYAIPSWLSICVSMVALLAIFYTAPNTTANKLNLIVTVFSTALIVAARPPWLNKGWIATNLAKIGLISYSLYLVHWPIIAFLNSANISGAGLWWPYRVFAVTASFACSWVLFRFVESRFRIVKKHHSNSFKPIILLSICLILISLGLSMLTGGAHYQTLFRANHGLSDKCASENFHHIADCKTADAPTTLLWGDSYAMHLAPGLKLTAPKGIVQAALATCVPIGGASFYSSPNYGMKWAKDCINFNRAVENHAANNPSIELVILSSLWHLVNASELLVADGASYKLSPQSIDEIALHIEKTTTRLRASGKKVVVIAPPPTQGFNIAKCHERKERGQWRLDVIGRAECRLNYSDYKSRIQKTDQLMTELIARSIPVYFFNKKLCDSQYCDTKLDNVILYRDTGHLSYLGSEHYAERFKLFSELKALAK